MINNLKSRIDIVTTIRKTVNLDQEEDYFYFGQSPFTNGAKDKFLVVSGTYQWFRCLKTGKNGDVIDWVMATDGIGFEEAVARLAKSDGQRLTSDPPPKAPSLPGSESKREDKGL
ncbi:CHC2 zinc finger domain-containing protein [Pelagicoccus albus]|uniref:Zinc finger CHC2-type domain-containing protein n=1 Tax=Pelagicoccus albus TaxID=415222 RepID=A0A7X1B4Q5_9BACT|nr:CHC2 zinc finger domain-containing protein [Pelagicoccus albus]MBC2605618.1 hypothetical protein [Pelagicoccus albus]